MEVIKTMIAGNKGMRKYQREWGDHLVTVRYCRDTAAQSLLTTVERVVDRRAELGDMAKNFSRDKPIALRIGYAETDLRLKVKNAGACWSHQLKLWIAA